MVSTRGQRSRDTSRATQLQQRRRMRNRVQDLARMELERKSKRDRQKYGSTCSVILEGICNRVIFHLISSFLPGSPLKATRSGEVAVERGFLYLVQHAPRLEFGVCTGDHIHRNASAMDYAARGGHLPSQLLRWLHEHPRYHETCSLLAIEWAAQHGHLNVIEWLCSHREELFITNVAIHAPLRMATLTHWNGSGTVVQPLNTAYL